MPDDNRKEDRPSRLNMGLLKWATIVLPILFLALLDLLRHTVFAGQLHTLRGFLGTYAVIFVAVVVFSFSIFGFIGRLQRRVIEQNQQFAGLINIAKEAAAKLRLEELLSVSLDHVLSSMKVESGLICLVDLEQKEHSAVCYRGLSPDFVRTIQRAKIKDAPIASEVVRTGKPVIIERPLEDPRVSERAKQSGVKAMISTPLKFEEEVNGILAIVTRQERHFSAADRHFLESIGGQLGMAIRNAKLYEQSELQNRELGALLAVGKAVTSLFDLAELLSRSLDTVIEVVPVDAAEIWLASGEAELTMQCHCGSHREAFMEQTRFRFGEGMPGIVAQSREPMVVHDLPGDERFLRREVVRAGFHTLGALPLVYQGRLVGVLVVAALSADAVSGRRELRLLEGIGEWLAIAVENARLYQQVQDVAVVQERERIAREMHDGMAQLLGYINTQTVAVQKFLADGNLTIAMDKLTKMEEIARDLYADVREGILGLRITTLRDNGLLPTLRQYVEKYMEMSDIKVDFDAAKVELPRLPPPVEIQLMRIVQESLTNVRKHSKATEVKVAFELINGDLRVSISDNGQGFDAARLSPAGWPRFGLQTMKERAEALGGNLAINTGTGKGTRVEVSIPLTPRNAQVLSH